MTSNFGRRVFKHGLILTTTLLACATLQAEHEKEHGTPAEKFVHKAMKGGQMEVEMGQLGQQKGQSQQVKDLAATLVRDHTQASQRLQQLAASKNIKLGEKDADALKADRKTTDLEDQKKHAKHAMHKQQLDKLRSQSGAEFDKAFVTLAIKDHKKDIAEFERCRTELTDPELKAFIDETLPTLRQHLQMAQSAARTVGVDESSIVLDRQDETDSAVGGAAAGTVGTRGSDKPSSPASNPDKDRSSIEPTDRLNGATETDASGTISQNSPSADLDANVGDRSISADVDVDRKDNSVSAELETEKNGKFFQKGDGKVLGLSTDKHDGKFLGIIPNPRKDKDNRIEADVDVDTDRNDASIGGAASVESGKSDRSSDTK